MDNKNRSYRIIEMIILLASKHKKWRVKELAEHFSVTTRTIYRDFEVMDEMRIPIYQDEPSHTYSILEDFYFKAPDMTSKEVMVLLLVGQAFRKEIFPYKESLNTAIAKIINSLPPSVKKVIDNPETQMVYQHGAFVDLNEYKEIISELNQAINNCNSVRITYYSLSRDETSDRIIDPYKIAHKNGACYLIGHCHNRDDVRIFRVDRIRNIQVTDEIFDEPDFDIGEYLKNTWGVERSDNEKKVVLIFKDKAAKLVKEMKWHDSQQIIDLPDDRIQFEVVTGSMQEMKNWILGYGASVEVIRPEELRQEVMEEIGKMEEIYKKNTSS